MAYLFTALVVEVLILAALLNASAEEHLYPWE